MSEPAPESKTDEKPAEGPKGPIPPERIRLRLDSAGRLFLLADGVPEHPVVVRRAFPWSMPDRYFALRSKDGTELALLERLDELSEPERATVQKYLALSVFVPQITRIHLVRLEHGFQHWDVETDRGPLELRVQEREDVRFLSETRFTVKDADGNLYEIADVNRLDQHSQKQLAKLV